MIDPRYRMRNSRCNPSDRHRTASAVLVVMTFMLTLVSPLCAAEGAAFDRVSSTVHRTAEQRVSTPPATGVRFNNPLGDRADRYRLLREQKAIIKATPAGAVIRLMTYNLIDMPTAHALIAAHNRGVSVRVVLPAKQLSHPAAQSQVAAFGANPHKSSFIVGCHRSCMGKHGAMHVKLMAVSRSGNDRRVVTSSSTNQTAHQTDIGLNDMIIRTGDKRLYKAVRDYFDMARFDRPVPHYKRVARIYHGRIYFFPSKGSFYRGLLRDVDCTWQDSAGVDHKSHVTLTFSILSADRLEVAREIIRRHNMGCDVRVLLLLHNTAPEALRLMLDAGVPVRFHGTRHEARIHSKTATIDGSLRGRPGQYVVQGSLNANEAASDNQMLELWDNRLYQKYLEWFDRWYDYGAKLTQADIDPLEPVVPRVGADD